MSHHIGFNAKKTFVKHVAFDAKRLSLLYSKILFKRFDINCANKIQINRNILAFDYKKGKYVDFKWITKKGTEVFIRAVRTNKNNIIVYYKNIFTTIYMFFYIMVLNLLKK